MRADQVNSKLKSTTSTLYVLLPEEFLVYFHGGFSPSFKVMLHGTIRNDDFQRNNVVLKVDAV